MIPDGRATGYSVTYDGDGMWTWVAWDGPRAVRSAATSSHQAHRDARDQLTEWELAKLKLHPRMQRPGPDIQGRR